MSSVDVIVPCYRYGHFLRECVVSVLEQTGPHVRVLIIDDASPDNTASLADDLARADSRVLFIRHSNNKGHIATYNEGIEWAAADYLLLLSADDYLLPGALERAAAFLDAQPNVGFVFGNAVALSQNGSMTEITPLANVCDESEQHVFSGQRFIEISICRNIVPTPTAVVRTVVQKRAGGYRPELPHAGDMEMWWRLAAHAPVGVLGARQAVYRRHSENMSHIYFSRNPLPDFQQRKCAIDCFMNACETMLNNARQMHGRMLQSLSYDAVAYASAAFNDGEIHISRELAEFALRVFPECRKSFWWKKLICKRLLGPEGWRAIEPVIAVLRQCTLSLKRR